MPSRTDLLFPIAFFVYAILGGWLCVSTDFAWWALALFAAPAVYYAALVVCSASESLMGLYFVVFGCAVGTVLLILLGRLQ